MWVKTGAQQCSGNTAELGVVSRIYYRECTLVITGLGDSVIFAVCPNW